MILGIGCDLIDIARIEKAIQKEHFLSRIYTEKEREHIKERGADAAAGLFAAKEAAAKALGCGFDGFFTQQIEIVHDALGKPLCMLSGGALARLEALGGGSLYISISHAAGFAQAFCVIESSEGVSL